MTAIGRALMAHPSMILLGRAVDGARAADRRGDLRDRPRSQHARSGCRSCSRSRTRWSRCAMPNYGYILENGRVVMDGDGGEPRAERGREGVLPRAFDGGAQELPRRQALPPQRNDAVGLTTGAARRDIGIRGAQAAGRRASFVTEHFDTLETRDPEVRERAAAGGAAASDRARQDARAGIRAAFSPASIAAAVTSRAALRARCRSRASPSCSSCRRRRGPSAASPRTRAARRLRACSRRRARFTSRKAGGADYWRLARALFAAGFRARRSGPQLLLLSLHAGRIDARDRRAGARLHVCSRPAPGRRSSRCRRWPTSCPDGYVGTPSFLKIILDKADEHGRAARRRCARRWSRPRRFRRACAMRSLRAASRLPGLRERGSGRDRLRDRARAKGLVVDEGVLVEIVRPGTGDPVAPGEVGEVVVTHALQHRLSADPLRHRRSVRVPPGRHAPCGRTNARIKGWLGTRRPDARR